MNNPWMKITQLLDLQTKPSLKKKGPKKEKSASISFSNKLHKTGTRFTIKKPLHIKPPGMYLRDLEWMPETGTPILIDRMSYGAVITEKNVIYVVGGSQHNHSTDMQKLLSSVISSTV